MKRIVIGNWQSRFLFRCSRPGVDAMTMTPGDDAVLHEDQRPVAAIRSGVWSSLGNDQMEIATPELQDPPDQTLMNPGDGTVMSTWSYYAVWEPGIIRLINSVAGARRFAWAVLSDVGDAAAQSVFNREDAVWQITQLFRTLHGREPDAGGLNHWVNAMQQGMTLDAVTAAFRQSDEFRTRATDQITQLYRTLLGREPDGPGLNHWVKAMQQGMSLDAVAAAMRQSVEYRERQQSLTTKKDDDQ